MERASGTAVGNLASGNLARGPRNPRRAETWANEAPRNRGNDAKGLSVQDLPVVLRCQWVPTRGLNRLLGRGDGDVEALNPDGEPSSHTLLKATVPITVRGRQVWSRPEALLIGWGHLLPYHSPGCYLCSAPLQPTHNMHFCP